MLPCWNNISIQAFVLQYRSSMFCQSCQLMWRSCSNPGHIDLQYWRQGTNAGVSQWPLWESRSLRSFHHGQRSDQWRVSPSQCRKLKWLEFGRHLGPCVGKMVLLLLLCDGFQESCLYQKLPCLFWFRARMSRALNNFCYAGRTNLCPSSMSCQSCQLMWRWCINPVHIDHQYWRRGTHAGVSQWPWWEKHFLRSFYHGQRSDQLRVSPSQCWKLRTLDFGRHLRPVSRRFFGCWCCCLTASRNSVVTRNHADCSSSGQEWAEHWRHFSMPEEYKHLCHLC